MGFAPTQVPAVRNGASCRTPWLAGISEVYILASSAVNETAKS